MKRLVMILYLVSIACQVYSQSETKVSPAFLNLLNDFQNVRDFTISEDSKEAYFTAQSPSGEVSMIMHINRIDQRWTTPEIASFSGNYNDLEPFLSMDRLRLYFASNRPKNDSEDKSEDYDIWYVERESNNANWSKPINIGEPINSKNNEFYPSLSSNNNLYFTSDSPGSKGKDDIFFSEWKNDTYSKPISLGDSINTEGYEYNAFIAPNESYLIFGGYNRKDGFGSGDLYISSRKKDGSWSKAKNLGQSINSAQMDYCPFINSKSNTLYFTSKRSTITVPDNGFESASQFLKEITKYENGLSRIYQTSFNALEIHDR